MRETSNIRVWGSSFERTIKIFVHNSLSEHYTKLFTSIFSSAVNGGWSGWGIWESCSVTCDMGIQKRHRSCSNPFPSALGLHCFGEAIDVRICRPGACAGMCSSLPMIL